MKIRNPAMMLAMESWAAKPRATPAMPRPASAVATLNPSWSAAITTAKTRRITR